MSEATAATDGDVAAFSVAQLMVKQGWRRIDLVKMDVEGAEAEILRHADGWLDRVGVLVVELHDRVKPGCAESLYHALHGRRFCQEVVGRNLVIDLRPSADRPDPTLASHVVVDTDPAHFPAADEAEELELGGLTDALEGE